MIDKERLFRLLSLEFAQSQLDGDIRDQLELWAAEWRRDNRSQFETLARLPELTGTPTNSDSPTPIDEIDSALADAAIAACLPAAVQSVLTPFMHRLSAVELQARSLAVILRLSTRELGNKLRDI